MSFVLYIISLALSTMIRAEDTYVAIIIGFICSLGLGLTIEIFRRTQQSHRSLLHAEDVRRGQELLYEVNVP